MAPVELCQGQAVPKGQTKILVTTIEAVSNRPEEFLPGAFLCFEEKLLRRDINLFIVIHFE